MLDRLETVEAGTVVYGTAVGLVSALGYRDKDGDLLWADISLCGLG